MLVKAVCLSANGTYERVLNTNTVIYFDERGVMFAPGCHAKLAPGEFRRILQVLEVAGGESLLS